MTKVTVVCGPPGAGKTSYVQERARWGDLIIDIDAIFAAIGGTAEHGHPPNLLTAALAARDALINSIDANPGRAWIIMGGAKKRQRQRLQLQYGAKVVVLETGPNECLRRIQQDPKRATRMEAWQPLVARWWKDYQREEGDERIAG